VRISLLEQQSATGSTLRSHEQSMECKDVTITFIVKFIAERGLTLRVENVGSLRNLLQAKCQKKKTRCFWWPILQQLHKSL